MKLLKSLESYVSCLAFWTKLISLSPEGTRTLSKDHSLNKYLLLPLPHEAHFDKEAKDATYPRRVDDSKDASRLVFPPNAFRIIRFVLEQLQQEPPQMVVLGHYNTGAEQSQLRPVQARFDPRKDPDQDPRLLKSCTMRCFFPRNIVPKVSSSLRRRARLRVRHPCKPLRIRSRNPRTAISVKGPIFRKQILWSAPL